MGWSKSEPRSPTMYKDKGARPPRIPEIIENRRSNFVFLQSNVRLSLHRRCNFRDFRCTRDGLAVLVTVCHGCSRERRQECENASDGRESREGRSERREIVRKNVGTVAAHATDWQCLSPFVTEVRGSGDGVATGMRKSVRRSRKSQRRSRNFVVRAPLSH